MIRALRSCYTKPYYVPIKVYLRKSLRKDIGGVILTINSNSVDDTFSDYLLNVVMSKIDMFSSFIILRIP